MKTNFERKLTEEVDSSMGGQLKAKGIYPKLVVDNNGGSELNGDKDAEARFGEMVGPIILDTMNKIDEVKKKEIDTTEIKEAIADTRKLEAHVAHDIVKLKNDKEGLLFTLADLRVKAKQAATEKLDKRTRSLLDKRIASIQKNIDEINGLTPEVDSSDDHKKVQKIIDDYRTAQSELKRAATQKAEAEKKLTVHPGDGRILGDASRAESEMLASKQNLEKIVHDAELLENGTRPNPVRDESIATYSNEEALEAKEKFRHSKTQVAPGIFGHTYATEAMQKEMDNLSTEEPSVENVPTLETTPTTTALEVTPHRELVPAHETVVEASLPKQGEVLAVNTQKTSESKEQSPLTKGALAALKNADDHGVPKYADSHLVQTARANGVNAARGDRAKDILDKLRAKIDPDLKPPELIEQTHHTKKPKTHTEKQEIKHKNMKFEHQPTIEPIAEQKPVKTGEIFEHVDNRAKEVAARQVELAGKTDRASEEERVELEKEAVSLKKSRADLAAGEHFTHVDARLKEVVARQAELSGKTDVSSVEERKGLEKEALSLDDKLSFEWDTSLRSAYEATVARLAEKNKEKNETTNIVEGEAPEAPVSTPINPEETPAGIELEKRTENQTETHEEEPKKNFEFPAEVKAKLNNPKQLELFEKIEGEMQHLDEKVETHREEAGMKVDTFHKVVATWKNVPTRYKLLISAGMIISGATLGAAAVTPLMVIGGGLRALGGASMFVGLEETLEKQEGKDGVERSKSKKLMHKVLAGTLSLLVAGVLPGIVRDYAVDHGAVEKIHKLFGGGTPHAGVTTPSLPDEVTKPQIEATNKGLDELAAAIKAGDTESIRLTEETLGVSHEDALKLVEQRAAALSVGSPDASHPEPTEKLHGFTPLTESELLNQENLSSPDHVTAIATVESGDNVWKLAHQQLEAHYGEKFDALPKAQQTYLIDAIKDKINADPKHFGIESGDANVLKIGDKVDFKEIFGDKNFMDSQFGSAHGLSGEQMQNIDNYTAEPSVDKVPEVSGTEVTHSPEADLSAYTGATENVAPTTEAVAAHAEAPVAEAPARTMSAGEAMTYYKTPEAIPHQMSGREADAMMNKASSDIAKITENSPQVTAQMEAYATRTLNDDLNTLLGSKGFLGFGRESGINSINWKDPQVGFGNKTVNEIINAHPSAFPADGVRHFGVEDYAATTRMQGYITNIRRVIGISPDVNEKIADFVRRAAITSAKLSK